MQNTMMYFFRAAAMIASASLLSVSAWAADIVIDGYAFEPKKIVVQPGETVTWTNAAASSHTVVVGNTESRRLRRDAKFSHSFPTPGEYPYRCGIHRSMKGVVVVAGEPKASMPAMSAKATVAATAKVQPAPQAPAQASADDEAKIMIVDFMRFEPTDITVKAGTTVVFENHDGSNHIILFDDKVKSERLRHDAAYSRTFEQPGDYPFVCAIHGKRMSGSVHVVP